jgi:sugar phosphate permease
MKITKRRDEIKMVKKNENLLVLGMLCLITAFIFEMFGNANVVLDVVILFFIGIAIFSNAGYIVLATSKQKKK